MTISETENSIISDLLELGDVLSRTEFLVRLGKKAPGLPNDKKNDDNLIKDCQVNTWIFLDMEKSREAGYRFRVQSDSQSVIVRGALMLIGELYDNRTCGELAGFHCRLVDEECFSSLFSDRQRQGISSIVEKITVFYSKYFSQ